MEIYFAPDDDHPADARVGHELALLDGLITPKEGVTLATHGYGVSALVRYLFEHEAGADNFILDTYQAINQGTHAAAALQASTTTDIRQEWQAILEDLVRGNIFADVTWPVIEARSLPSLLEVSDAADTTGTVVQTMNDLSGMLATVTLDNQEWTSLHRLEFWTEEADCGLSLLGVRADGGRDLVARGTGSVSHSDPAQLQSLYDRLLVLVANPRFQGPDYNGSREVTLQGRVRVAEVQPYYPRLSFHLQINTEWDDESLSVAHEMNIWNADGDFTNGVFTAAWDSTIDDGAVRFVGEITVNIDPQFEGITSWNARTAIWHSDDTGFAYEAAGGAVPTTNFFPFSYSAWLEELATCSGINSLTMTEVNNEGTRNLVNYSCAYSSYLKFFFENPME
jgi:hypothetical protein